jgi:hypothetical protein
MDRKTMRTLKEKYPKLQLNEKKEKIDKNHVLGLIVKPKDPLE